MKKQPIYQPKGDPFEGMGEELKDAIKTEALRRTDKIERKYLTSADMVGRMATIKGNQQDIIEEVKGSKTAEQDVLNAYRASETYDAKRYASGHGRDSSSSTGLHPR